MKQVVVTLPNKERFLVCDFGEDVKVDVRDGERWVPIQMLGGKFEVETDE